MDTVVLNIVEPVAETVEMLITPALPESVLLTIREANGRTDFRQDWVAPYCYIGRATPGSLENSPVWIIYQIKVNPDGSVETKQGTGKWTERLTILYT